MITAVYRPRQRDVLLINDDGTLTFPVAADAVPDLVEALASAFAVPLLAAALSVPPIEVPVRNFLSAV